MRRISGYCITAILLLAFGLRVYHLAFQASMSDDALGLLLARHNPLDLFALTSSEPFPPTFYVTLSLWSKLVGTSEYAGRFYSLLFSLASVALIYRAGQRWLGDTIGLVAAFLLAINPLDIYFAQEVRMYTMLTMFSLASSFLAWELLARRAEPWLAYTLVSVAAVMTHAFALFVLLAQDLAALIGGPRGWRWLRAWALCQIAILAVFASWAITVARKLEEYQNGLVTGGTPWSMLWRGFSAYSLGFSSASGLARALPGLLVALVALGVVWLARRALAGGQAISRAALFLLSYLLAPFLVVWLISFARPVFFPRYMVICLPAALLLAASGIVGLEAGLASRSRSRISPAPALLSSLSPALAGAALLAMALASASHLRAYYQAVPYVSRSDMQALAAYLGSVRDPAVITNTPPRDPLYAYYLPASLPVVSTQSWHTPARDVSRLSRTHRVVWFLPFGNTPEQAQTLAWLSAHAFPAGSRWFGHAQVLAFATPVAGQPGQPRPLPAPVVFGQRIELAAVNEPSRAIAGDPLDVTLRWLDLAPPRANYSVFVHLIAAGGAVVAQHDGWPADGSRPTGAWRPGQAIVDKHGLLTTHALPAGVYRLEVGLYDAAGKRLPASSDATSSIVGRVRISRRR